MPLVEGKIMLAGMQELDKGPIELAGDRRDVWERWWEGYPSGKKYLYP